MTLRFVGKLCLLALLAARPSLALAQAAPPPAPESAVGDFMRNFKFKHPPVTPKDFVVNSRASSPRHDFMPLEATPPDHDLKVKSPAEIAATTASLDALRGRHDRLIGRKPRAAGAAKLKKPVKAAAAPQELAPAH